MRKYWSFKLICIHTRIHIIMHNKITFSMTENNAKINIQYISFLNGECFQQRIWSNKSTGANQFGAN